MRGPARPYLHSKLMCWVALARGLAMADLLAPDVEQSATWSGARDAVRDAILARGWNDQVGAYTQFFGSDELDASPLLLALALALTGQLGRARTVLDRAAACATDLGLFAEQVDPVTGEPLGNFPQGFSHLGLVTAAHALAEAERARVVPT